MIKEITAKVLLSHVRQPEPWFGLKYNMNLYRGCQHQCIYCDSRSECYRIENFKDILVKKNSIELLDKELAGKRVKGTIGTGSMNDPYMPAEADIGLTRRALQIIAQHRFPVHILTKSALVLRDIDLLVKISKVYAAVSFSIITVDDSLGKALEPGASLISQRFQAMKELTKHGIYAGVLLMPVLPFITDTKETICQIFEKAYQSGASYIIAALGVTLRDRQREYFYAQLDQLFPGISLRYKQCYRETYSCAPPHSYALSCFLKEQSQKYNIPLAITPFNPPAEAQQLELF